MNAIHPSWKPLVSRALSKVDAAWLRMIENDQHTLPQKESFYNAFSLPLSQTKTILFGESPYPRAESANGYAFWDAAVSELWSEKGLSTRVNRATSLRNIMKMLLVANGQLNKDTSPVAIQALDKSHWIQTGSELFNNFLKEGILLLNASLSFRSAELVRADAQQWLPFINDLLVSLVERTHTPQLLLFGKIANTINRLPIAQHFDKLIAEHPYNLSFINNTDVLNFFRSKKLLDLKNEKNLNC